MFVREHQAQKNSTDLGSSLLTALLGIRVWGFAPTTEQDSLLPWVIRVCKGASSTKNSTDLGSSLLTALLEREAVEA